MSTLQTINVKHPSSASNNVVLDSSGNATLAGSMVAASSYAWRNRLINGDMRIDQRNAGASVTPSASAYTIDRWLAAFSVGSKMSFQRSTVVPAGFTNSIAVTSTAATTVGAGDFYSLIQYVENVNWDDLMWGTANARTVTLSFWVRSSLTGTFVVAIRSGGDDVGYPATYTINAANTWEQKSITIPGPTSGTFTNSKAVGVWFQMGMGSDFNATANAWGGGGALSVSGAVRLVSTNGATFYATGVQLEVGTVATPFERRDYGRELILCQRYFQTYTQPPLRGVMSSAASAFRCGMVLPVLMRTAPTATVGSLPIFDGTGVGTVSSVLAAYLTPQAVEFDFNTSSFSVTYRPAIVYQSGSTSLLLSAEL